MYLKYAWSSSLNLCVICKASLGSRLELWLVDYWLCFHNPAKACHSWVSSKSTGWTWITAKSHSSSFSWNLPSAFLNVMNNSLICLIGAIQSKPRKSATETQKYVNISFIFPNKYFNIFQMLLLLKHVNNHCEPYQGYYSGTLMWFQASVMFCSCRS